MNRGRINQGVLLVLVGLYFLLRNLGWIDDSFIDILISNWPILLIFAGIYVMLSRSAFWFVPAILSVVLFLMFAGFIPSPMSPDVPYSSETFAHAVGEGVRSLELTFDSPAAQLHLAKGTDETVSGTVAYYRQAPETSGRQIGERFVADFRYGQSVRGWSFERMRMPEWDVTVPSHLPLSVTVHAAYGDLTLDLRGIDVKDVDIQASAGKIHLMFDESVEAAKVNLDTAASLVNLTVPKGIGMRVKSDVAVGSTNLKELGFVRDGEWYVSPEYDTAASRVDVYFDSAVGKIRVIRETSV